ncbi:MAG: aldolase catalytic domain-containing protein, partial [Lachnospiraceae bacterium]|nr:aldolase catalytic domain-containing protein [Lachnospiraceae bacterium]
MKKRYLLDCTLRDGGYINDWEFGHDNLVNIYERVVASGVDVIEIGFLDDRREFDINRSIMPDTKSADSIYGRLDRKETMVVGMIDYGTCDISNLQPCKESFLDGIRVIFKKNRMRPAMEFCGKVKELGYKVFSQLVSITSYSDEELLEVIGLANETEPFALSMVDTYGLLNPAELKHIMTVIDANLNPGIVLGFHAHNNFQLGYTNTTTALDYDTERDVLVDGTLYGMGKSAGNAPLELIAMHMNHNLGKSYHISQILEAIDANISQFYRPASWGYNMFYYLAASNDCHPNYVAYLMDKQRLSVRSVNEILSRLEGEKKLLFDRAYIEKLYIDYQNNEVNDAGE